MRRHIHSARDLIIPLIDFFYPPFRWLMDLRTFRYAASGGANTVLGLVIYYISFKFIFREKVFDLGFYAFEPHTAALFISFIVNFLFGFFLMKYVVFTESNLRGRVQLFRYLMVFLTCLVLNYFILKLFVEYWHIYAVFAQILATVIIVIFSYLVQKHFTFRIKFHENNVNNNI
ncbi:MAG: phenylalanine 4-monooxygenase [Chitinophagaceae bacterium]